MVTYISHNSVMNIVEGISVIIAQNNGESSSFEQMWASKDDRSKLDIYYREAIGDLENNLTKWLAQSNVQFSMNPGYEADDYILYLTMPRFWPVKLTGLFGNKIQDYMVHSVVAGWLNTFAGLTVKADYATMAGQDLQDVREILEKRAFYFEDSNRQADPKEKPTENAGSAVNRQADPKERPNENAGSASSRMDDKRKGDGDGEGPNAGMRNIDNAHKDKSAPSCCCHQNKRHRDNGRVHITHDTTDWSGGITPEFPKHKPHK